MTLGSSIGRAQANVARTGHPEFRPRHGRARRRDHGARPTEGRGRQRRAFEMPVHPAIAASRERGA